MYSKLLITKSHESVWTATRLYHSLLVSLEEEYCLTHCIINDKCR